MEEQRKEKQVSELATFLETWWKIHSLHFSMSIMICNLSNSAFLICPKKHIPEEKSILNTSVRVLLCFPDWCLILIISIFCSWLTERQVLCQRNTFAKSETLVLHLRNLIQDPPAIKSDALFLTMTTQNGGQRISPYMTWLLYTFDIKLLEFNSSHLDIELNGLRTVIFKSLASWACHEDACCQTVIATKFSRNHFYCFITK